MSDLKKAMAFIGVGAVLLSAVLDVVLLKLHASGELLFLSIAFVSVIASIVMAWVLKHYEAVQERREREAALLR